MKSILLITLIIYSMTSEISVQGQEALPYEQIPDSPQSYTAGNVTGRMIDGLGFRYYWATEGLTEADLQHQPSQHARNMIETLDHIYRLSKAVVNAPQNIANRRPEELPPMEFEELRSKTLRNLERASELFKDIEDQDMETCHVIFERGENRSEFPIWNLINGQIADAIWHTGQLVLMRRTSGNPINPRVDVFTGALND
jgi:hypothetical protein